MKTAVVYHSEHHGNTKKVLDAIAKQGGVTLIEASDNRQASLAGYDFDWLCLRNLLSKI